MPKTVELLINGASRRSQELLETVTNATEKHGLHISKSYLIQGNELEKALRQIRRRKPGILLVGGGDGTVSHTLHAVAGTGIELGIIPLGTTNNFARSLGLPIDVEGAITAFVTGSSRAVDLGLSNGKYFANVMGVGLSAVIADSISDKNKRRFGRFAYALEGAWQLLRHKPFTVVVEDKDRELQLNFETHQLIVANGRYHAGREIAVDASVTSRELIIFALGGRSKLSFMVAMIDFYLGKRKSIRHSSYLIGRDVRIETNRPQLVELDGEVSLSTPSTVRVSSAAVKVRVA